MKKVPVRFMKRHNVYNAGETAGFTEDVVVRLCRGDSPIAMRLPDYEAMLLAAESDEEETDPDSGEDSETGGEGDGAGASGSSWNPNA